MVKKLNLVITVSNKYIFRIMTYGASNITVSNKCAFRFMFYIIINVSIINNVFISLISYNILLILLFLVSGLLTNPLMR